MSEYEEKARYYGELEEDGRKRATTAWLAVKGDELFLQKLESAAEFESSSGLAEFYGKSFSSHVFSLAPIRISSS